MGNCPPPKQLPAWLPACTFVEYFWRPLASCYLPMFSSTSSTTQVLTYCCIGYSSLFVYLVLGQPLFWGECFVPFPKVKHQVHVLCFPLLLLGVPTSWSIFPWGYSPPIFSSPNLLSSGFLSWTHWKQSQNGYPLDYPLDQAPTSYIH